KLVQIGEDGKEQIRGEQATRVKTPGAYQLRFANIDARLTVWVDHDLPFSNGQDYPPPEMRGENEHVSESALIARRGPRKGDLEPAGLGSKLAEVKIHNLRLWRDTYYTLSARDASDYYVAADGEARGSPSPVADPSHPPPP